MCGLCGVYGVIGHKEKNAFSLLSLFSQVRGKDSTGVGLIYNNKKKPPIVAKSVGGQESLALDNKNLFNQVSWALTEMDLRCIIGHNRWATVGNVDEENAHPFHEGDIIGCHNGTISTYQMYNLDSHSHLLSDSHIIMKELGNGKSVEDTIEYLSGAWALVWYHIPNRRLHMCRNNERTLFVAETPDNKTMFWASEIWMLTAALSRCGIKHKPIASVMPDKHLVWTITKKGVVNLEESTDAVGGKSKYKHIHDREPWWGSWGYRSPKPSKNVVNLHKQKGEEEEDYEASYTKMGSNSFLHRSVFEKRIKDGCSNCTGDLTWEDRDLIVWDDYQTPLCLDCAEWLTGKKGVH